MIAVPISSVLIVKQCNSVAFAAEQSSSQQQHVSYSNKLPGTIGPSLPSVSFSSECIVISILVITEAIFIRIWIWIFDLKQIDATSHAGAHQGLWDVGCACTNSVVTLISGPCAFSPFVFITQKAVVAVVGRGRHCQMSLILDIFLVIYMIFILFIVGNGPSGRLWALRACLPSSFTPFGHSGCVTHATVQLDSALEKSKKITEK